MSPTPSDFPKKRLPRDGAGSFDLPSETGAIKKMLGLHDFMEIYTVGATYRVKSPDSLDPSRTVPDMPWSQSLHSSVGASNPIVARIVIQLADALGNWPLRNGKPDDVKHHLHACKEDALICEAAYNRLKGPYDKAVARINERKINIKRGIIECPSIPTLRDEATAFLTSMKRAMQSVGEVFNQFYVPDGKRPKVSNANFDFALTRLENSQPVNQNFIDYLRRMIPFIKRFVDLRNGLEHSASGAPTVINDFRITPKGITPPSWSRPGLQEEGAVVGEMGDSLEILVELCEHVFFFGLLDNIAPNFRIGFEVEPVPDTEIDPECPIRYRLKPKLS